MAITAPHLYIGGVRMADHALADRPVLSGLSFVWGTDSIFEYAGAGTLSAVMLIRSPGDLSFLAKGAEVGLIDSSGATLFTGRITELSAEADEQVKTALRVAITAADTTAELESYDVGPISWGYTGHTGGSSNTRLAQIRAAAPAGWSLVGTARTPEHTNSAIVFTRKSWLWLLDLTLRGQRMRRHNTSTFTPGAGISRQLSILPERQRTAGADKLRTRNNQTWYAAPSAPNGALAMLDLPARSLERAVSWRKSTDDTITSVKLTVHSWATKWRSDNSIDATYHESESIEVDTDEYVNMRPLQAAAGVHQIDIETDLLMNVQVPWYELPLKPAIPGQVRDIINLWLDAGGDWRPDDVTIFDSRKLTDYTVRTLLDVTKRHMLFAYISGMSPVSPITPSLVRAFVIAGRAVWDRDRWIITLTFGRIADAPAEGDYWTPARLAAAADLAGATCATVGDELNFADFRYIGAP